MPGILGGMFYKGEGESSLEFQDSCQVKLQLTKDLNFLESYKFHGIIVSAGRLIQFRTIECRK